MTKSDSAARPRRTPPVRPGHREPKVLLTVGAVAAVLAGWLALTRESPATNTPMPSIVVGGVAQAGTTVTKAAPALPATQVRPRPIARTRASR